MPPTGLPSRRRAALRRADYIAGIRAGRYVESDGDIMGKKRKGNKEKITEKKSERVRERDAERNEPKTRSDKDRVRSRDRSGEEYGAPGEVRRKGKGGLLEVSVFCIGLG